MLVGSMSVYFSFDLDNDLIVKILNKNVLKQI